MSNRSAPPRWMRKDSAQFAAKVAHYCRMTWAVVAVYRSEDCTESTYRVGCGTLPSAALNSLAKSLSWWRLREARSEEFS